MTQFRKLAEEPVYDGSLISVGRGTFEAPDGETFNRDLVHHPGAVSIVPVDDDVHVVVVEDEKLAVADWGIATEMTIAKFVPPRVAAAKGLAAATADARTARTPSTFAIAMIRLGIRGQNCRQRHSCRPVIRGAKP